jgi:hypothetical protein
MMLQAQCSGIKESLIGYISSHLAAQQIGDTCVVTLPFETLDKRWVDVFIEPRVKDFYLIHDGGKAVNELILQGMKITPAVERGLSLVASRFGISYSDEMFQSGTKMAGLSSKIYSVGMSSALAMVNLLEHVSEVEEEPIEGQIGTLLNRWGRNRAKITENVRVAGEIKQHTFNFLVSPRRHGLPIGVSILHPTAGALAAAERFGFKAKDLADTKFGKWPRVAVEDKAEIWSPEARRIVKRFAKFVIPIRTGERPTFEQISEALETAA